MSTTIATTVMATQVRIAFEDQAGYSGALKWTTGHREYQRGAKGSPMPRQDVAFLSEMAKVLRLTMPLPQF